MEQPINILLKICYWLVPGFEFYLSSMATAICNKMLSMLNGLFTVA
jgi:hypothetical protein